MGVYGGPQREVSIQSASGRSLYSSGVVQDGLVLNLDAGKFYSYPQSGTNWTDISGSGNNGTLTNGPTYSSANGGSLVFDGVDDYVIRNLSAFNVGCISIWIMPNATVNATSSFQSLLTLRWTGVDNSEWYISLGPATALLSNEYITIANVTTGTRTGVADGESLLLNTWYNLIFNVESGTYKIYVNGVKKTEVVNEGGVLQLTDPNTLQIGALVRSSIVSVPFLGKIAQVSIYNRALTATEVSQNFNALRSRYGI